MAGERAPAVAASVALGLAGLGSACGLPTTLGELPGDDSMISSVSDGVDTSGTTSTGPPPSPSTTAQTSDTGPVGPMPMHAWVMRYDQWLDAIDEGMDTVDSDTSPEGTGTDTDGGLPPDTLVVQISTGSDSCGDPQGVDECSGQWQITLLVPPPLQTPGTYDLANELSALIMMSGQTGTGECFGGGGTLGGTAELTVVSPEEVSGTLAPLDVGELFDPGEMLDFVALGC